MNIFDFDDYKDLFRDKLKTMPKRGHGQLLRIAKLLDVHTTLLTHIFKGKSNLSPEQALKICGYLGFTTLETDYFMVLVQIARAGDKSCKDYYRAQQDSLRKRSLDLKSRFEPKQILDEKDQAQFYSEWTYSAVNLLTAIEGFQTPYAIAARLGLKVQEVTRILDFLTSLGLCRRVGNEFHIGDAQTFLGRDSALLRRHLLNWRGRVAEKIYDSGDEDIMYTHPVVVSKKDFAVLHAKILEFLKDFRATAEPSACEELCCLNLDWVRVR